MPTTPVNPTRPPAAPAAARPRRTGALAALAALAAGALLATGCAQAGTAGSDAGGDGGKGAAPVRVGLVYSKTGLLAAYGKQYADGFRAGLDHATHGTGKVNGHAIVVTERDDAGDASKAVAAGKDLIGKGAKILAGSTDSGIALQMAPLAAQNKVLFLDGPAATDALTGINSYTFRSGRQSYQDTLTAAAMLGDAKGKKVTVLAQDSTFGKANVDAVKAVIGGEGARVSSVLAPPAATDLTPFARQVRAAKPDLVFVAWAGSTAPALWTALDQQGVLTSAKVTTGLAGTASYPVFGAGGRKITFLAHYFPGAAGTAAEKAMITSVRAAGGTPDLFTPDGFTAAQMVVRAVEGSATDTSVMVKSLEGWTFQGVKGEQQIRAEDHAMLQPMFQAKLTGSGKSAAPELVRTLPRGEVAPPVQPMAG
ncbi:substrate-binding domain-containing protein [Streptomyces sp. NPDC090306]|uniref:substrate-binding domain-containing protein n=1 Tax=Streptomyces sp. NPDC090306 TaxID=3365961 RepID=UPI003823E6F1